MADEAAKAGAPMETFNIAQFLGKIKDSDETRGHVPVYPGDVLVVDEATQVSTEDALRIAQIARRCGAMVVGTFDPEQLGAVDAGGIFPLIAARHGSYRLTEVRRFTQRMGAARPRCGCARATSTALAEYAARGRVYHGPQDRVYDDAVTLYLNGYLERPGRPPDGHVERDSGPAGRRWSASAWPSSARSASAEITLADGNQAGPGDLVRARLNTRIDADGQTLANRDVVRVESINDSAFGRLAAVVRQTGAGSVVAAVLRPGGLPRAERRARLCGQRPRGPGPDRRPRRTWWSTSGANRSQVYVGATRGREKNTLHVVTGPPDPAQPTRAERDAYADGADRTGPPSCARRAAPTWPRRGPAADAGPAQRPADGPVGGGPRPGAAAGRAGADRARGDPGRAGLHDPHRAPAAAAGGVLAAGRRAAD